MSSFTRHLLAACTLACVAAATHASQPLPPTPAAEPARRSPSTAEAPHLQVGDLVFIRVAAKPFREVADATGSWTNHVGIVTAVPAHGQPSVAESTVPRARTTTWSAFTARSEGGRVAVLRLRLPLDDGQRQRLRDAVARRDGVHYDTGFDLHSRGQFCSRFVREVLAEATGVSVGEVETFATLLTRRPDANLPFWRVWFLGSIPWQRETVTPASVLASPHLVPVFDGTVTKG